MKHLKRFFLTIVLVAQVGCGLSCASEPIKSTTAIMPSPASCGEELVSRENEDGILENYFEDLSLYNGETGNSFEQDQSEAYILNAKQFPTVGYKSVFPNHLRLCVQAYDEEGTVVFDKTINTNGQGSWSLQPLTAGQYVMRVIVKNMIIESYVLRVKQDGG
jgi:hypothetical protein